MKIQKQEENATTGQHQKDLQYLRALRPIDDDFMHCLFKDNIPLAEFVLRIITGKQDLIITDYKTQKDMKRYLKENPEGVSEMCRIMEDMRNETILEEKKMTVLRMLKAGKYVLEEIADISGLSLDEIIKLKKDQAI